MAADISTDRAAIARYLISAKTVAIIGLSADATKASYGVAQYLQRNGYKIIPVSPVLKGPVLGETPYASLADIPSNVKIDIIDVFRRAADMPDAAAQALARPAPLFWMQLGISNPESAAKLMAAGFDVIQDRCIKIEHASLA